MIDKEFQLKDLTKEYWTCFNCKIQNRLKRYLGPVTRKCLYCGVQNIVFKDNKGLKATRPNSNSVLQSKTG